MLQLSRRRLLLRLTALFGGASLGEALLARRSNSPAGLQAPEPAAALTQAPAPLLSPTFAVVALPPKPDIIRFHPDGPSTVVQARHSGVWQGEDLSPAALRQMLYASITALAGLTSARAAWAALFRPGERIAVKVNAFSTSLVWTHAPLATALTDSLQDAGVPAEQIFVYDHLTSELEKAGFAVNKDGPGVRCRGAKTHIAGWKFGSADVRLNDVLLGCDALINVPILKTHGMAGISFALKNHYGSVDPLRLLHGDKFDPTITQINALPPIRDRSRLIIGDVLGICLQQEESWPFWRQAERGDAILMSYDPVAVDAVALRLFCDAQASRGADTRWAEGKAKSWLKLTAELGLGTDDETHMRLLKLDLA
mgnify:CR=1 FL=1